MTICEVIKQCEQIGAWFGIEIKDLNQKNDMEDTPLHTVCSWEVLEPVKLLIENGANVNAVGDLGCTPLFNAIIGENIEVVEFLLKAGADKDIKNSLGRTPLQYACNVSAPKKIIDILKD